MIERVLEFALGAGVVVATLVDVVSTVLVPGHRGGGWRAARWLRRALLPLSRWHARRRDRPGQRPSNAFAPLLFLTVVATWLVLLAVGYGLALHALRDHFDPRLAPLSQAIYVAGSSIATLGVSEVDASGFARWVLLVAAVSGFGVITVSVSFILQVQSALHGREPLVLTLSTIAGAPPSGVVLLEALARLDRRDVLDEVFASWRDWSANVLHSHSAFPVLAYFHSTDAESDWLTALEAVLDAATLVMTLTEEDAGGATILHRVGARTAARLVALFGLVPEDDGGTDRAALPGIAARLAAAGYRVRDDLSEAGSTLARLRADYAPRLEALARHLGAERSRDLD